MRKHDVISINKY